MVVNVIKGYRLSRNAVTGTFYDPTGQLNFSTTDAAGANTWKLYDATHNGPAVVQNPPRSPFIDPPQQNAVAYRGFWEANYNRQTVVYMGTNGGMMHAFRADNGAELWAYIPDDILGFVRQNEVAGSRNLLRDFVELVVGETNGVANHVFLMSGAASVEDAFLRDPQLPNGADWRTVIAFGRGKGGKYLSAMDVTDIGDWDGNLANTARIPQGDPRLPELRFNVGNLEGLPDGPNGIYDGLGETWSIPVIGEVRLDNGAGVAEARSVLFAGSGYGCPATNEGQFYYVLQLEDGAVIRRFGPINSNAAPPVTHNVLMASPAVYNPHSQDPDKIDPRDYVTRSYIGDVQGNFYKLDSSGIDPLNWTFGVIAQFGLGQPIGAPAAFLADRFNVDRVFVFIGTGGDDRVNNGAGSFFKLVGLLDDDPDGIVQPAQFIQDVNGQNFFFNQSTSADRVTVPPVTAHTVDGKGQVFFASTRAQFALATCTLQFFSTLYAFEGTTGLGSYDLDASAGGTQSSVDLGEGKVTGLYHRGEHLYVSQSGGFGVNAETEVRGKDTFDDSTAATTAVTVVVNSYRVSPF
jgi:type IV pilus assembly protein PilY1